MHKFIFFLIFISIYSCGAGIGDTTENLGGGYTYRTDGGMRYLLSNTFQKQIYPNIVEHVFDKDFIIIVQKPSRELHKMILSSDFNSNYLMYETLDSTDEELRPGQYKFYSEKYAEDSALYKKMEKMNVSLKNTKEDRLICDYLADSIIKHDPYYKNIFSRELDYWIIVKNSPQNQPSYLPSGKIYGPYSKNEYLKWKKKLRVSEELKLKFEK